MTDFTEEQINALIDFSKKTGDERPFELLSSYICPELVGESFDMIRKAVLLTRVSEVDLHCRQRLHTLLWGKAGTGKTVMLSWVEKHFDGIKVNAEMCSKVGLVGDARGNKITGGLLHQYDSHIVCTDEIDKMKVKDQNGLLQAMEEGEYRIVKGKLSQKFRAEIRVIGSANDINKITDPLLDRFDFVFHLKTPTRDDRANNTPNIVKTFLGYKKDQHLKILNSYLEWISEFEPSLDESDDTLNIVIEMIQSYIKKTRTDIDSISYRNLEYSILRTAYALAKLERNDIKKRHVKEAIIFKDKILQSMIIG